MRVDVFFPEVEFENAQVFRLQVNLTCTVKIVDEARSVRWFADNDQVLSITTAEDGKSAEVKSLAPGKSEIWLFTKVGANDVIVTKLFIDVFDREAASFKVTSQTEVSK